MSEQNSTNYLDVELKLQPPAPEVKRGDKLIVERDGKKYSVAVTDAQPLYHENYPLITIGQRIKGRAILEADV